VTPLQMAGMGIDPMQAFGGGNPMAAMGQYGGQQLTPQVAALAPTRQSLEQQVRDCDAAGFCSIAADRCVQFSSQLQQLEAMGFSNRDQNIR
jgi:hypothetical protein